MRVACALVCLGVLACACTTEPKTCAMPASLAGETLLPAEIDDILKRRCRMCHSDPTRMFAPMPLVTWEDVQALRSQNTGEFVFEAIGRRIHDEKFPMPPLPAPSLSDEQKAAWPKLTREEIDTLDAWIADCAPSAD